MARILVIDDEESIRELLERVLRRKGHEVLLASDGNKGLDLYRHEQPDLAILDLYMPGKSGLAVLEVIRAQDPTFPVVILTGMPTETAERQARALAVTDFLEKGFSLHRLGAALVKALRAVQERSGPVSSTLQSRPARM